MSRKKTSIAVTTFVAVLVTGGCTQSSNGNPGAATDTLPGITSSGDTPSAPSGPNTAPTITDPLDVSKFLANPCLSITPSQAVDLTVSIQSKPLNIESGKACSWPYGPNLERDIVVTYITPDAKNGLQNLYNVNATAGYRNGYFEPTNIGGYPALYEDLSDTRQKGRCNLSVGVNPQVFFTVLNRGQHNTDLCKGAAKVAADVVETIKKG